MLTVKIGRRTVGTITDEMLARRDGNLAAAFDDLMATGITVTVYDDLDKRRAAYCECESLDTVATVGEPIDVVWYVAKDDAPLWPHDPPDVIITETEEVNQ